MCELTFVLSSKLAVPFNSTMNVIVCIAVFFYLTFILENNKHIIKNIYFWSKKIKYDPTHLDMFPGAVLILTNVVLLVPMAPHYSLVLHPRENSLTWVQLISIPPFLRGEIRAGCCRRLSAYAGVRATLAMAIVLLFLFGEDMKVFVVFNPAWLQLQLKCHKGIHMKRIDMSQAHN